MKYGPSHGPLITIITQNLQFLFPFSVYVNSRLNVMTSRANANACPSGWSDTKAARFASSHTRRPSG